MRRMYIGLNVGIPLVDVMFGWNAGYLSYGASINALIENLQSFYGMKRTYGQLEASRFIAYWSLIDFKFEIKESFLEKILFLTLMFFF